jgi:hypothetical protein
MRRMVRADTSQDSSDRNPAAVHTGRAGDPGSLKDEILATRHGIRSSDDGSVDTPEQVRHTKTADEQVEGALASVPLHA